MFINKKICIPLIIILIFGFFALHSGDEPIADDDFSNLSRINPVPLTRLLVAQEKFAEAYYYLSYFMDYDYVNQDPIAQKLYKEIQDVRGDFLYKVQKINSGFWSGESDELEGQIAGTISDLFVIGDIRDLCQEGKKYVTGEDNDPVTIALSGIGLAATSAAVITAGTTATAKPAISFLKVANKVGTMPKWLCNKLVTGSYIATKTKKLDHIAEIFYDVYRLNKTAGVRSTLDLLGRSQNLDDFRRLAKFGCDFGENTHTLLKIAGDDAVTIYQKFGKTSKNIFKESTTFGNKGVKALEKHGAEKFNKFLEAEKATSSARRRMTNIEIQLIESGKKVNFSGQYFIRRNDLFSPKFQDATGRTNIERMDRGLAPIGKDGSPINLHHMKQQNSGTIAEVSHTEHKTYSDIFHRYAGKNQSEIDRAAFDKIRSAYWKDRAKEFY
jgi:hypothetical protein